jgi:hypothetical protein
LLPIFACLLVGTILKCVCIAGLANYCVPAGEAYQKALDIAREITQKVRISLIVTTEV